MERWRRGVVLEMDNELGPRVKTDELHGVYHFNWIRSVGSLAYEQEMEDLWEEAGLSLADDEALAARFPGTMGHLAGEEVGEAKEEL